MNRRKALEALVMARVVATFAVALGAAGGAGCATSGSGGGDLVSTTTTTAATVGMPKPDDAVTFHWRTNESGAWERGTIVATLPDGRTFQGEYAEPPNVSETAVEDWLAWRCEWDTCFGKPAEPTWTRYGGRLFARLTDGQSRMSCTFHVVDPPTGPAYGGSGKCKLSDGDKVIEARLSDGKRHWPY